MTHYIYHEKLSCFDLPNGARALAARYSDRMDEGVILADCGAWNAQRYVVWDFYRRDLRSTSTGFYSDDIERAAREFKRRVSGLNMEDAA